MHEGPSKPESKPAQEFNVEIFNIADELVTRVEDTRQRAVIEAAITAGKLRAFEYTDELLSRVSDDGVIQNIPTNDEDDTAHGLTDGFGDLFAAMYLLHAPVQDFPRERMKARLQMESVAAEYSLKLANRYFLERKGKDPAKLFMEMGLTGGLIPAFEEHVVRKIEALSGQARKDLFKIIP